jgi:hypothetical protein
MERLEGLIGSLIPATPCTCACTRACTRPRTIGILAPRACPATFAHGRAGSALASALVSANRRHIGPTWRDVGVYAVTRSEPATMTPLAPTL